MIVADRETWISGDPDRVFQIFRNLIENANKYGGDEIRAKVTRSADRVRVQVWDDGPGIPGALIEAAFSEYVQVHDPADSEQSGFGLGLSIVKKLADAMGASVEYRLPVGDSGGFLVEFLASERTEEHALGVVGD
ncbi:MAG TPA: ATP-binding protein [Actinobacteria bacterium]|nr:ATP-binding protein [Actinomycetota bacterium]